ncbi:MAG: ferric iron uptake transcriptional regulator [Gammaproteobacteria bacterium]|nr:ferric iron uptake transcriptional regulator [Gammaproteobacteria bacterium]
MPDMDKQDIRDAGLKVTVPRTRILEILSQPDARHMTADLIYQRLHEEQDTVSLATVYRVLLDFENAGLVVRHQFENGHAVFELNLGKHHDHLVCINCGRIVEFHNDAIERQQKLIAEASGFEIRHHSLTIYGVCGDRGCRGARNS